MVEDPGVPEVWEPTGDGRVCRMSPRKTLLREMYTRNRLDSSKRIWKDCIAKVDESLQLRGPTLVCRSLGTRWEAIQMPEALEVSDSPDYVASEALGEDGPMGAPRGECCWS